MAISRKKSARKVIKRSSIKRRNPYNKEIESVVDIYHSIVMIGETLLSQRSKLTKLSESELYKIKEHVGNAEGLLEFVQGRIDYLIQGK